MDGLSSRARLISRKSYHIFLKHIFMCWKEMLVQSRPARPAVDDSTLAMHRLYMMEQIPRPMPGGLNLGYELHTVRVPGFDGWDDDDYGSGV